MARVLVVEDSRTQAEELAFVLEQHGHLPDVAPDGESGLRKAREQAYDLIISDIVMPGINGYELCRALKSAPETRATPIVLLTSLADPLDILRGLEAGADNYVTKPFDEVTLLARIKTLLSECPVDPLGASKEPVSISCFNLTFNILSDRAKILRLLVSSLEDTVATNAKLEVSRAELEAQNAKLSDLNAEKNRFLGMASHDLRNPLGVIMNFSEFLTEPAFQLSDSEKDSMLRQIRSMSEFMLRLVNDLLNVARIEAGDLNLQLAMVDLNEMVGANVALNQVLANSKKTVLEVRPAPGNPQIKVDRSKIDQVLNNLVTNAVKFSPPGARVQVIVTANALEATVSVIDQGPGIPEAERTKLFQPFQRTSVKSTGGEASTGLGLVIARRIIEGHGGRIWLESEVGRGSTFAFRLPLPPEQPGSAA